MSLNATTIGGTTPNYATFTLWEADTDNDLTNGGAGPWTVEQGRFRGGSYNEFVDFAGATVDADGFRVLVPDSTAARYKGTEQGIGNEACIKYTGSTFVTIGANRGTIRIGEARFVIDGLGIECGVGTSSRISNTHFALAIQADNVRLAHVGVYDPSYPTSGANHGIYNNQAGCIFHHCLVVGETDGTGIGFNETGGTVGTNRYVNCLADLQNYTASRNKLESANAGSGHTLYMRNCAHGQAGQATDGDFDYAKLSPSVIDSNYCASEDNSADDQGGANHKVGITWATEFPNASTRVYGLATSSQLKHAGVNPGTDSYHGSSYPSHAGGGALAPWYLDMNLDSHEDETGGWSIGIFAYDLGFLQQGASTGNGTHSITCATQQKAASTSSGSHDVTVGVNKTTQLATSTGSGAHNVQVALGTTTQTAASTFSGESARLILLKAACEGQSTGSGTHTIDLFVANKTIQLGQSSGSGYHTLKTTGGLVQTGTSSGRGKNIQRVGTRQLAASFGAGVSYIPGGSQDSLTQLLGITSIHEPRG